MSHRCIHVITVDTDIGARRADDEGFPRVGLTWAGGCSRTCTQKESGRGGLFASGGAAAERLLRGGGGPARLNGMEYLYVLYICTHRCIYITIIDG